MKNKIVALCLCVALAVIAIGGATLAYFTDTADRTNTFTSGNVKIELIEKQRDGKGGLEDFKDGKVLLPIVGSAQGPKDTLGLSTAKNYVDKIITVKNLSADAYVRVYMAIPSAIFTLDGETNNYLHINQPGKDTFVGLDGTTADKAYTWSDMTKVGTYTDGGIEYTVVYSTYADKLTKAETAGCAAFVGLYLDYRVDYNSETGKYFFKADNGQITDINYDFSKGVKLPVLAAGVQADGFDKADDAFNAAFGANYNPWATTATTGE